jgi:hypothetical protein
MMKVLCKTATLIVIPFFAVIKIGVNFARQTSTPEFVKQIANKGTLRRANKFEDQSTFIRSTRAGKCRVRTTATQGDVFCNNKIINSISMDAAVRSD